MMMISFLIDLLVIPTLLKILHTALFFRAELIVMSEEAVADMPLDSLEWYHEKYILDYFAECGLFLRHGLTVWAEITLRQLVRLRCESPDIGPDHHETLQLRRYLMESLRAQSKHKEADEIEEMLKLADTEVRKEKEGADVSLWDSFVSSPGDALSSIMDPNKKEREEEARLRREVKASKKAWRRIRQERFRFLDVQGDASPSEERR